MHDLLVCSCYGLTDEVTARSSYAARSARAEATSANAVARPEVTQKLVEAELRALPLAKLDLAVDFALRPSHGRKSRSCTGITTDSLMLAEARSDRRLTRGIGARRNCLHLLTIFLSRSWSMRPALIAAALSNLHHRGLPSDCELNTEMVLSENTAMSNICSRQQQTTLKCAWHGACDR